MNEPHETRHVRDNFITALVIFLNNDIKFDANKTRAHIFAQEHNHTITWSIARDTPSNKVIAEKPNLVEEKKA